MRESVIYQEIYQEGEAQGMLKARKEFQQSMVIRMLNEGISMDAIARLTELSLDQILQIQSGQNR